MKRTVKFVKDFPEAKLVGRKLGPFREGEEADVRFWEASILEEKGIVESEEDLSSTGVRKLLIKAEKSSQPIDIPDHFYSSISCEIRRLLREGEKEEAEKIKKSLDSFVKLRVQKLAKISLSSKKIRDKTRSITPEEDFLVNKISHTLKIWRRRLDHILEEPKEEVGAHAREKEIRRSVQGIVGNTANI